MTFFHYTCDHRHPALLDAGIAVPGADLTTGAVPWTGALVWFTDLAHPIREALGLTSHLLACDRTEHRYRVTDDTAVEPWTKWARSLPPAYRDALELAPGARPAHWFVATTGVPVVYDPIGRAVAS